MLEAETEAAFRGALDTFRKVSPERVREEWLKTMKASKPSRAFEVMRRTGILEVTYPELLEQVGCEQNKWHAYDVWNHTMRVLDESEGGPVERVAARLPPVTKLFQKLHPGERYYLTNLQARRVVPAEVRQWADDLWLFPYYTDPGFVPYDARPGGVAATAYESLK
mgnify:CR=1 FL=1